MKPPIRFAIPKGRMSEECISFFHSCGITDVNQVNDDRGLIISDKNKSIEFLLTRSKDVGTYVEQGAAEIGVLGIDLLEEHNFDVFIPITLPFGKCRLSIAYPKGKDAWKDKKTFKVATKYPKLTSEYFYHKGYNIEIVELYGSIEIAPLTGISDIIVDLVSTGQTLLANNLEEGDIILHSKAALIINKGNYHFKKNEINNIINLIINSPLLA